MDLEDEGKDEFCANGPLFFPTAVQAAISEVFSTDEDPLDAAEFSAIDYINEMFPTEQSLTNLDDTITEMRGKIAGIDDDLRLIVRGHGPVVTMMMPMLWPVIAITQAWRMPQWHWPKRSPPLSTCLAKSVISRVKQPSRSLG